MRPRPNLSKPNQVLITPVHPPAAAPLPNADRVRGSVAAAFAGGVALPLSVFFLPNSGSVIPFQLGILFLVSALSAAAAFASVSASKRPTTGMNELTILIRCGARAGLLAAMLAAAMTVLGARLFNSQLAALITAVPAALAILPASFVSVITGAIAAGIRLPRLPKLPETTNAGRGTLSLFVVVSAIGFLSALFP